MKAYHNNFSTTLHLNTINENTLYLQTIKHDYRKA